MLKSRNETLGYAERTRKNLAHIEEALKAGEDVHVITQLGNSLLGLIVFPFEREPTSSIAQVKMAELSTEGWPEWEISLGKADTLGELARHLRNATAHGRMSFSSDNRCLEDVFIRVENYYPKSSTPHWRARISAADLRDFCLRFIQLLEGRDSRQL